MDINYAIFNIRRETGLKEKVIAKVLMANDRYLKETGALDITDDEIEARYVQYLGIMAKMKYAMKKTFKHSR